MGSSDVLTRPARPPDRVLRYGPLPDQVADLRLPDGFGAAPRSRAGRGPRCPLVIFLHGGFWRAAFDRAHTGPLAAALCTAGFAVCTPEYRRVGQPGGGWPGTFDDVAAAVDRLPGLVAAAIHGLPGHAGESAGRLPGLAAEAGHHTDAARPILAGHSAGGHLALWAASRHRLPAGSPWHSRGPAARTVIGLAGVSDLASCYRQNLGNGAAAALLGGGPAEYPARYAAADPAGLLPAGMPVRLVHGRADDRVPCQMSLDYAAAAAAAGDRAHCDAVAGAGHFELIDPLSAAWLRVAAAFDSSR